MISRLMELKKTVEYICSTKCGGKEFSPLPNNLPPPWPYDVDLKMNIYIYIWNFENDWMCLPSLTAPQVNLSITYESGVEFPTET